MLRKLLLIIDLFGTPVTMNFSGRRNAKTTFGGLCTVGCFIFVIWATINSSQGFISTSDPRIVSSELYVQDPREFFLSSQTFPIAFAMRAPSDMLYDLFVDETIFEFHLYHSRLERIKYENGSVEERWTNLPIAVERCTPEYFGELASSFDDLNLDQIYCIAKEQSYKQQIRLQGAFASPVYETLIATVSPCNNKTSGNKCASQETMNNFLNGGWFSALYSNMVMNPRDFNRPDSRYRDLFYTMTSLSDYKEIEIDLGRVEVTTDLGRLIEDPVVQNYIKVNKITEFSSPISKEDNLLISCIFQMSKIENSFSRSYKKIQEVFAEIGGLANVFMLVVIITSTHFLRVKFRESLMNELFDIRVPVEKEEYKKIQNHIEMAQKKLIEENLKKRYAKIKRHETTLFEEQKPNKAIEIKGHTYQNSESKEFIHRLSEDPFTQSERDFTTSGYSPNKRQIKRQKRTNDKSKTLDKRSRPASIGKIEGNDRKVPSAEASRINNKDLMIKDSNHLKNFSLANQKPVSLKNILLEDKEFDPSTSPREQPKRTSIKRSQTEIKPLKLNFIEPATNEKDIFPKHVELLDENNIKQSLKIWETFGSDTPKTSLFNKFSEPSFSPESSKLTKKSNFFTNQPVDYKDNVAAREKFKRKESFHKSTSTRLFPGYPDSRSPFSPISPISPIEKFFSKDRHLEQEESDFPNSTPKECEKKLQSYGDKDLRGEQENIDEDKWIEDQEEKEKIYKDGTKSIKTSLKIWEFFGSFILRSPSLKQKMDIINEGSKNIVDRLNVVNILKKLGEIDKLKALILDHDELVLFNGLPKPEIVPKSLKLARRRTSYANQSLRNSKFIQENITQLDLKRSYEAIKQKKKKTKIDEKLLEIFGEVGLES